MKQLNPQAAAAAWQKGMQGSAAKLTAGIQGVTESPMAKAAAAADRMIAGVTQAVTSGKWAASLNAVSLSAWQNAFLTKGVPIMAQRAAAALPKVQAFMTQFLPFIQSTVAALPARADLQTNIQRAVSVMNASANFKYQKPGG